MDRIANAGIFCGLVTVISFMLGGSNPLLAGVSLFCLVAGNLVSISRRGPRASACAATWA